LLREPQLVLDDINRTLATIKGARAYGVVINDDNTINQSETVALRAKMASERGDVKLFDFGGTIEEIKARSMQETNLPAPQTPEFR
jgi:N-methylhydantoinase B